MGELQDADSAILVEVVSTGADDREISWDESKMAQRLTQRASDIQAAVVAGSVPVADALNQLPQRDGWKVNEASVTFGSALTAEAGAIITKASVGATLEVSVTFTREAT